MKNNQFVKSKLWRKYFKFISCLNKLYLNISLYWIKNKYKLKILQSQGKEFEFNK